jgi:hypothetical protein
MKVQLVSAFFTNGDDLYQRVCLQYIVKGSKTTDSKFPFGKLVWPKPLAVSRFCLRLVLKLRFHSGDDSHLIKLPKDGEIVDGLRR